MKKLFTLVVASLFTVSFVSAQITATDYSTESIYSYGENDPKPDVPTSMTYQFVGADGQIAMKISYNTEIYTYNSKGLKERMESYTSDYTTGAFILSSSSEYIYDSSNQLIKVITYNGSGVVTGGSEYSDYENGYYKNMKNVTSSGTVSYWKAIDLTFENEKLVSSIDYLVSNPNNPDVRTALGKTVYTYSGDKCTKAEYLPFDGTDFVSGAVFSWVDNYTYSGDKLVNTKRRAVYRGGAVSFSENDYAYSNYASSFVPKNFKAVQKNGAVNVVELTWDAPESAVTGYKVFIDGTLYDVTGNSYTTDILKNGSHKFAVIAVNGSEIKNISQIETLELQDAGVKPATEFKVIAIGEPELDEYNSTVYPVTVAWTAPVTTSKITGYKVYYSQYGYESVAADQTSAQLKLSSWACVTNGEDGEEGLPVTFWVVVEYETGISEKSNQVTEIPYNGPESLGTEITTVEAVKIYPNPVTDILYFSTPVSAELYNSGGSLVKSVNNASSIVVSDLVAGTYFVKTVNKAGAVVSNTIIIK